MYAPGIVESANSYDVLLAAPDPSTRAAVGRALRSQIKARISEHGSARSALTLPGFYPATNDGRSFQAEVRGIRNRALILVNGLPLAEGLLDATISADDLLTYDLERIEVTLGPGSALFGADAVAATINLITRTSTAAPTDEIGGLGGNAHTYSAYIVHNAPLTIAHRVTAAGGRSSQVNCRSRGSGPCRHTTRFTATRPTVGMTRISRGLPGISCMRK